MICSGCNGGDEQQGDRAPGPEAPEHPARARRQDEEPPPRRHQAQDRRLWLRKIPSGRGHGCHAMRQPHVYGELLYSTLLKLITCI